ncbi:MAG TPA: hypothetical protein PKH33_09085 [bacterium]|nr:hypothetical protein [bacterium]
MEASENKRKRRNKNIAILFMMMYIFIIAIDPDNIINIKYLPIYIIVLFLLHVGLKTIEYEKARKLLGSAMISKDKTKVYNHLNKIDDVYLVDILDSGTLKKEMVVETVIDIMAERGLIDKEVYKYGESMWITKEGRVGRKRATVYFAKCFVYVKENTIYRNSNVIRISNVHNITVNKSYWQNIRKAKHTTMNILYGHAKNVNKRRLLKVIIEDTDEWKQAIETLKRKVSDKQIGPDQTAENADNSFDDVR